MHFLLQKPLLAHLPNIRLLVVAASDDKNKLELESIKAEDKQIADKRFIHWVGDKGSRKKIRLSCIFTLGGGGGGGGYRSLNWSESHQHFGKIKTFAGKV